MCPLNMLNYVNSGAYPNSTIILRDYTQEKVVCNLIEVVSISVLLQHKVC